MTGPQLLGTVGFWLIEISYLTQIRKLYLIKESEEFDLLFPILNVAGRILALTYSVIQHENVFIFGFSLGITLRLILMFQVIWYRYKRRTTLKLQEETISI